MDKRDDGFFSRRLPRRTNDRSYNSTDSSLVTVDYQQCLLSLLRNETADQVSAHGHAAYYVIASRACSCGYYTPDV